MAESLSGKPHDHDAGGQRVERGQITLRDINTPPCYCTHEAPDLRPTNQRRNLREDLRRITLTDREQSQAIAGLYDRLMETKRYIGSSEQTIGSHQDHQTCCASGIVDRERVFLAALNQRKADIVSALEKLGETP